MGSTTVSVPLPNGAWRQTLINSRAWVSISGSPTAFRAMTPMLLAVDPKTLAILVLATVDAQGGRSTFTFANLRENVGLSDNEFIFQMPRGVDVVTDAPAH